MGSFTIGKVAAKTWLVGAGMLQRVMTISSGKFPFSNEFEREGICRQIEEVKAHYMAIADMQLLPDMASKLDEDILRRSIFSTAAIEGNPLGEDEVGRIISGGVQFVSIGQAEAEILALKDAYGLVMDLRQENQAPIELTEEALLEMNFLITRGVNYPDHEPGVYRDHRVSVGGKEFGGVYVPPKNKKDIKLLVDFFIDWINNDELMNEDPYVRAALAHFYIASIHPFGQGNGRTARLMEAYLLSGVGIKYLPLMLSTYYHGNIRDYYRAFRKVQKSRPYDMSPFLLVCASAALESVGRWRA